MEIEQFYEVPLDRLRRDLIGKRVAAEVLAIVNGPGGTRSGEERFMERFPNRAAEEDEVRDFLAQHYTPLLQVPNRRETGIEAKQSIGPEDIYDLAVCVCSVTTEITDIELVDRPLDQGKSLAALRLENRAGVKLAAVVEPRTADTLVLTITENPETGRREYAFRMFNCALVIAVL